MAEVCQLVTIHYTDKQQVNPSMAGKCTPILPGCRPVISAFGKKKFIECQCQKQASILPPQPFPFPSSADSVRKLCS